MREWESIYTRSLKWSLRNVEPGALLHNNRLSNIFTNRTVDYWDSLPNEIVNAESYTAFARET